MLHLTDRARAQLQLARDEGELAGGSLRVFIDHRCHCGKAHFSLGLEDAPSSDDTAFEKGGIPFVADPDTLPELPSVEIDFIETVWTKGFTIRNVNHECGPHMMGRQG